MIKGKNKIRITTMLTILTFILIPLLSSNVSALVTWSAGTGWTTNPPAGPPIGGMAMSAPGVIADAGPPPPLASVIFTFGYTFTDLNPGAAGSRHRVDMTVVPGGFSTTNWVNVPAGGLVVGTHSSPTYTNVRGTLYTITVTITCQDLNVGPPYPTFTMTGVTTCVVN